MSRQWSPVGTSLEHEFDQLATEARKRARIALAGAFELETTDSKDPYIESWRVRVNHRNAEWIVLRVKPQFPLELPTVYVEDHSLYGRIPHIDQGGELCYCDKATSTYDINDIEGIACWVVKQVQKVLDKSDDYATDDEFAAEFLSYWKATSSFLSLLEEFDKVREVDVLWLDAKRSKDFSFIVCEKPDVARMWIQRSDMGVPTREDRALFLPNIVSPRPPFPKTNHELYDWMQSQPGRRRWESYVKNRKSDRLILSTVPSSRGDSLIGLTVPHVPPDPRKPKSIAVNGFRPGKHPLKMEMHGWAGEAELYRFKGERIDLDRLVNRTVGEQPDGLKHIIVVGAGSIGSNLLNSLVKSHHFDRVSIFDPDELKVENVLRHALGFNYVKTNKAKAMAKEIGNRCPWVQVDAVDSDVLLAMDKLEQLASSADLVIFATGNAVAERTLSSKLLRYCRSGTSVVRLWFTANADRGILMRYISGKRGCPECLAEPSISSPGSILYEPGCSAGFAQFGGSRLNRFIAVCVDQILRPSKEPSLLQWIARPIDETDQVDVIELSRLESNAECSACQ